MKKLLCIIIALSMIFTAFPMTAAASTVATASGIISIVNSWTSGVELDREEIEVLVCNHTPGEAQENNYGGFSISCEICGEVLESWGFIINKSTGAITGIIGNYPTEIVTPDTISGVSVTAIDQYVFNMNAKLTSVTISESVTSIGEGAFQGCTSLTEVTFKAQTPPDFGANAFRYTFALTAINVPCGAGEDYKTALGSNADKVVEATHTPGEPIEENGFMVTYCTTCGAELYREEV